MFLPRQKWKGSNIVENETKPSWPDFLAFTLNCHCLESEHEEVTAQNKAWSYPVKTEEESFGSLEKGIKHQLYCARRLHTSY